MIKSKSFDAFGMSYRTAQFPAAGGMELMGHMIDMNPMDVLCRTEARGPDGAWTRLDNRDSVNEFVRDALGIMPPILVLRGLTKIVNDFSFGFAREWKGVKIPARFRTGPVDPKSSSYVDPMIAQILSEGMATLRELEEYYSLEDAFKMFDVIVAKSVNSALAHEVATKGKR